ncbi:hypothetical protein Tco_0647882 [Tanacetum coccineum]
MDSHPREARSCSGSAGAFTVAATASITTLVSFIAGGAWFSSGTNWTDSGSVIRCRNHRGLGISRILSSLDYLIYRTYRTISTPLDYLINGVPESMEHDSPDASATGHPIAEPKSVQSVPEENHAPPAMLQFAKIRKLFVERSDPRLYCRSKK